MSGGPGFKLLQQENAHRIRDFLCKKRLYVDSMDLEDSASADRSIICIPRSMVVETFGLSWRAAAARTKIYAAAVLVI